MKTTLKTGRQIKSGKALMPWRRLTVLIAFVCFVVVLAGRALDMQVLHSAFFEQQQIQQFQQFMFALQQAGLIQIRSDGTA